MKILTNLAAFLQEAKGRDQKIDVGGRNKT